MIVRLTADDSEWLLIQQRDHARLSVQLAERWGLAEEFATGEDRHQLLSAIRHHDDGWSDVDARLEPRSDLGRPAAFHELDVSESNAIWSRSIQGAESMGPLAAYAVAGHFLRLRRASIDNVACDSSREFLSRFEAASEGWLKQWCDLGDRSGVVRSPANAREKAKLAVDYLQFFDRLSLYICLGSESAQLDQPAGPPITLKQLSPWAYSISPMGLNVDRFESALPATRIPVAVYASAKQLKQAAVQCDLVWTFRQL